MYTSHYAGRFSATRFKKFSSIYNFSGEFWRMWVRTRNTSLDTPFYEYQLIKINFN